MKNVSNIFKKNFVLFLIGAAAYSLVEILWRGYTYFSMAVLGGTLFVFLGGINEYIPWDISLILQGTVGAISVTVAEFIAGVILNLWLGLGIWDYSNLPLNILGQVCPQFSAAWFILSIVAIVFDDFLRYCFWDEKCPKYHLF